MAILYSSHINKGDVEIPMNAVIANRFKIVILFAILLCLIIMAACSSGLVHQTTSVEEEVNEKELPRVTQNSNTVAIIPSVNAAADKSKEGTASSRVTKGTALGRKLVEDGSTNILLLGEDQVSSLYDTLCIMSISRSTKTVKIIMVPRDTYIEYADSVLEVLDRERKLHVAGVYKINYAHHIGAMMNFQGKYNSGSISFLGQVLEEKLGVRINDYVKVDLEGLMSLVDLFGGVEVNVPYDMNYDDPKQELSIHISKGKQLLDGRKAEGFVRFRQGYAKDGHYFEIGDPGRKKNKIAFLQEFIKQHGTMGNIDKIPGVLGSLNKNVRHSIGLGDMLLTYIGLAQDVIKDKYEIQSENMDGSQKRIDGSAYIIIE
jgi:polyisoprenyl-teichoic acid--peptidoglycan teichoic acid transferase